MIQKDYFSKKIVDSVKEEILCCPEYVSRDDLAERLHTTRETLCRKINDPRRLSIAELDLIAAALGKSLHFYFK